MANRYGIWSMQKDDLYFEGNRMGVDAVWLSDKDGNGVLLLLEQGNVSFEQTDKGVVMTVNAAVSGEGPKFSATHFPVWSSEVGVKSGHFSMYRTEAGKLSPGLMQLFGSPGAMKEAFRPFLTQYDTYLVKYEDIIGK